MNIESVQKLFEPFNTKQQYMKAVKKALDDIKSVNVYDIYHRIDEIYERNKGKKTSYLLSFFQHIKSAYDKMSVDQKSNVSLDDFNKLKKYAKKGFYAEALIADEQEEEEEEEEVESGEEIIDQHYASNAWNAPIAPSSMPHASNVDVITLALRMKVLEDIVHSLKTELCQYKKITQILLNAVVHDDVSKDVCAVMMLTDAF